MLAVVERKGWRAFITGAGDNQTLKVWLRLRPGMRPETVHDEHPEYIDMCIQSLLDELNQTMESVGLPLKAEETWASSRTWVFGKEFVCGSSLVRMALKRIARTHF